MRTLQQNKGTYPDYNQILLKLITQLRSTNSRVPYQEQFDLCTPLLLRTCFYYSFC